jgi:thymidylate synthase (FAD)
MNILPKIVSKDILNKGFVKLIDCMPRIIPYGAEELKCDYAIAQAARVSVGQGLKTPETDTKLIKFLLRNKHTSPFEMVRFKFHVKAPIFIQRQWIRHRTANVNEISGRYSQLKGEFYIPDLIQFQSTVNKQSSIGEIDNKSTKELFDSYMRNSVRQYTEYNRLIELGVSKETARIGLPLNLYTEFYWSIDLHNLFNFIKLRQAEYAQPEIRLYAEGIKDLIKDLCPVSIESFEDYVQDSVTFSKTDISQIKNIELYLSDTSTLCGVPLVQCRTTEQKELATKIKTINDTSFPFLL